MKVPARAKVPKTIQRNFFVAHIPSAMVCALSEGSCRQPLPAEGSLSMTVLKCKKKAFKFCKFFDAS